MLWCPPCQATDIEEPEAIERSEGREGMAAAALAFGASVFFFFAQICRGLIYVMRGEVRYGTHFFPQLSDRAPPRTSSTQTYSHCCCDGNISNAFNQEVPSPAFFFSLAL